MLPWMFFGHGDRFLAPEMGELVTESFTEREADSKPQNMGKGFNKLSAIKTMGNSHLATFLDGKYAVTEFFQPANWEDAGPAMDFDFVHDLPHPPRLRLHHYLTKSIEQLIKKWLRGMADAPVSDFHRPTRRGASEISSWIEHYATNWRVPDEGALPMARVVRKALMGAGGEKGTGIGVKTKLAGR